MGLPEVMPLKPPEVLTADFDGELVVYVPGENKAHHLDEGLSLVLSSCDGTTPTADFVAEVASGTGQTTSDVERWLEASIMSLAELGALTESKK
jgi:hypothetical protein